MGRLWTRDGEHGAATPRIEFVWKRYERAVELERRTLDILQNTAPSS